MDTFNLVTTYSIYLITNTLDGKVYVGYTSDPVKRWLRHQQIASRPTERKQRLHIAMTKHGIEAFTFNVVEEGIMTLSHALERERHWIERRCSYVDHDKGYNMTPGGEGGPTFLGRNHSPKTRARMSSIQRNRSPEWRENFKRAQQNRSEEWRRNLSISHQGQCRSEETRKRLREAWVKRKAEGRVISDEGRQRISEKHRDKICPQQTREGVSDARKFALLQQDVAVLEGMQTISDAAKQRHRARMMSKYWDSYVFRSQAVEERARDLRQRLRDKEPDLEGCDEGRLRFHQEHTSERSS